MSRTARSALLAAILLIAALSCALWSEYAAQIAFRYLIALVLAESWNLLAGEAGLVSLGTACAVGLGAYVLVGASNHVGGPFAMSVSFAAAAGAALGLLASPGLMRLRGLYFTVGTLALAEALRLLMINNERFGGATGLFLARDPPSLPGLVRAALALLAISWAVVAWAGSGRFSLALRAVRDDEDVASQLGVRAFRVKSAVFALSSALMAAAGALQAIKLGAVEPYGMFSQRWSIDTLAMVIIGGIGLRTGPAVGAAVIVLSSELLADFPEAHLALMGLLLLVMMRFAPRGLVGLWAAWRARRRTR